MPKKMGTIGKRAETSLGEKDKIPMTITERVEYAIFLAMMPGNMIPSDWFSGAMLGENNGFRKRVQMAAKLAVIEMAPAGTKS